MLSTLVTSKARRTLLTLFITHPEQKFYHAQLVRDLDIPAGSIQSELKKLSQIGFLSSDKEAQVRYFYLNKSFPLYGELKGIVYKTVGLADILKKALARSGKIDVAFIYGSVAKDTESVGSDIDLMVIGYPDMDELSNAVSKAEHGLIREINYTVFDPDDWKKNLKERRGFATTVYKEKKIFLIGTKDELQRIS